METFNDKKLESKNIDSNFYTSNRKTKIKQYYRSKSKVIQSSKTN